jgi:hypothetical protein
MNMKNAVFWDVMSCGFRENRRFGGTYRLHHRGEKINELEITLAVTRNQQLDVVSFNIRRMNLWTQLKCCRSTFH